MKIYIFEEPEFSSSEWCRKIADSVLTELKSLRVPYEIFNTAECICEPDRADFAIIISSNLSYAMTMIERARKLFVPQNIILVSNLMWQMTNFDVNTITANPVDAMRLIFNYLHQHGKSKAALYGVNFQSVGDMSKLQGYRTFGGKMEDVFPIKENLEDCYNELCRRVSEYDAVICLNDIAAYSLLQRMQKEPRGYDCGKPFIISCLSSQLTDYAAPSITAIEIDYDCYGSAIRTLINTSRKLPERFSSVIINIPLRLKPGETTCSLPFDHDAQREQGLYSEQTDDGLLDNSRFYADAEVRELQQFKKLLSTCDELDFKLITLLKQGASTQKICEQLFLSESGLKYRVSQIKRRCAIEDKNTLRQIIDKYMHE